MKNIHKILVLVGILVAIAALYGIDIMIAKSYTIEVVSVSPQTVPADGKTPVTLEVRVMQNGNIKKSHLINAVTANGGGFESKHVLTDKNGIARFTYYPYLKTNLNEIVDVKLSFIDESNSIFVSVPIRTEIVIKTIKPENTTDSGASTNDSIFG